MHVPFSYCQPHVVEVVSCYRNNQLHFMSWYNVSCISKDYPALSVWLRKNKGSFTRHSPSSTEETTASKQAAKV
jgi:hypothetical protein